MRTAALETYYPDEFYEDDLALNTRLAEITISLGNPLSNSKVIPADNKVLDVGEGKTWQMGNAYAALSEKEEEPVTEGCGCCDEHNHDLNTIWGKIACWFCKLWQTILKFFGA